MELSAGRVSAPSRIAAIAEKGLLGAMPAFGPSLGLAAKLIAVFPANHPQPSHLGMVVVFDPQTGVPRGLVAAAALTAARTAAASALAAELLAGRGARVLGILGAGAQAEAHLQAFCSLQDWDEIRIASRSTERARRLAETASLPGMVVCDSFQAVVEGAEVVACCTDSPTPVIADEWVREGALVISVGFGSELPPSLIRRAKVYVEWRGAASEPPPAGASELRGLDPAEVVELGEVLAAGGGALAAGEPAGGHEHGVAVYKSTGHAVEDLVAATFVLDRARALGVGTYIEL